MRLVLAAVLLASFPAVAAEPAPVSLSRARGELYFAPGGIGLDQGQVDRLKRRVPHLAALPEGYVVVVEGHTDFHGAAFENADLAMARAEAVASMLVRAGVPAAKIQVRAWGEARPAVVGEDPGARAANRRVVLRIVPAA